tara:strand:- start:1473 stop:1736 length:264 start_codon:yes stop_codon:yes gene_type:complete
MTKLFMKTDMYLIYQSTETLQVFKTYKTKYVHEGDLGVDFSYEPNDTDEGEILKAGKQFLNTCEVDESFRWEVDTMGRQYCELRRIG